MANRLGNHDAVSICMASRKICAGDTQREKKRAWQYLFPKVALTISVERSAPQARASTLLAPSSESQLAHAECIVQTRCESSNWFKNGEPRTREGTEKAAATICGWDCPLLTFIYLGFDCDSGGSQRHLQVQCQVLQAGRQSLDLLRLSALSCFRSPASILIALRARVFKTKTRSELDALPCRALLRHGPKTFSC